MTTIRAIRAALGTIKDPELGLDLVSLGLVYHLQLRHDVVSVRMTLTTPGCPLAGTIVEDVRRTVGRLPGITSVEVDLTFDPPWTPDRMTPAAKELLAMPT